MGPTYQVISISDNYLRIYLTFQMHYHFFRKRPAEARYPIRSRRIRFYSAEVFFRALAVMKPMLTLPLMSILLVWLRSISRQVKLQRHRVSTFLSLRRRIRSSVSFDSNHRFTYSSKVISRIKQSIQFTQTITHPIN